MKKRETDERWENGGIPTSPLTNPLLLPLGNCVCRRECAEREKKIKTGLENNFIVVFSPDDEVAWRFHDVTIIDKSPMACSP